LNGSLDIFNQSIAYFNLKNLIDVNGNITLNVTNLKCYNLSTYLINHTHCNNCDCVNGNCLNDTTPTCNICFPNFFGTGCNEKCSCDDDCFDGINGNGTCFNCSTKNLNCNYISDVSNYSVTIDYTDTEYFIGSLNVGSSNLTLKSTQLIILSNFFLNNSIINIDSNSSIIINKCLYLTNSTLLINLDGEHNSNKTLITFDSSCSKTSSLKYSFYNYATDICPNLVVESSSISVLFVNCNYSKGEENSTTTWIIILLAMILGSV